MTTIRNERPADAAAREALLDLAYGPSRFTKASERLREGRLPADGLSLVAVDGRAIVGTIRLWHVSAGPGRPALLLGPLAVHPDYRNRGIGTALMQRALRNARLAGHKAVILVGDASYYSRFGFSAEKTSELWMPGRYEQERLLAHEFVPGTLDGAYGLIGATGERKPIPALAPLVAALRRRPRQRALVPHAA
jgi:predicted N-acetyltransferase YhbS